MKQNKLIERIERTLARIKKAFKEEGVYFLINALVIKIFDSTVGFYYYNIFKKSQTFVFQRNTYSYFYHKYNRTWRNDRAVEVPIIREILKEYSGKKILEVGNVLSHYFTVGHDILDKYEQANGVINKDVVDFKTAVKYDLIVSISTLEHVGWDENPREPMKVLKAIENLTTCLAPGGKLVVTLSLGYNPYMDRLLNEEKIQFTKMYCLKRISSNNKWIQVDWKDVRNSRYHYLLFHSFGLIVGIIEKQ